MPDQTPKYRPFGVSDPTPSSEQRQDSPPADQDQDQPAILQPAAGESATRTSRSRSSAAASTAADFTGALVPAQFKLPQDLVQSLKLHAISEGVSMSDIVSACLTSDRFIGKAWVSTRRAA